MAERHGGVPVHLKNTPQLFIDGASIIKQSTLVISTSVISNNRLSQRENLIPVLT